jgi:UMF1 family MFS transporter
MSQAVPLSATHSRRPLLAWMLYDIASSTYAAVVPSVLFALHFTADIAAGRPNAAALWGITSAAALLVAGIVAPFVGAWADGRRAHTPLLAFFTLLCCVATALLPLPATGEILLAAFVFVAAQVGYIVAITLYDAYLERLGPTAGGAERLSARGWAVGFLGGIVALLVLLALPRDAHGAPDSALAFPVVGLMFLALAIPAIHGLRGVHPPQRTDALHVHPWRRVAHTLAHWREQAPAMRFLVAMFLINDAMVTVSVFVAVYLRDHFGVAIVDVLWLTLLYHLIALPATWLFGALAQRATARTAVAISIGIWIATILLLAFGSGRAAAVAIVVMLASVLGSTQALLRGMYARIVPTDRAAEFFGFNALAGRLSAALGPLTFAAVAAATGSSRVAILSLTLFLVGGGVLLWRSVGPREPAG